MGGCSSATTVSNEQPDIIAMEYQENFDKVFEITLTAVSDLGWRITYSDDRKGLIIADTPLNMKTWGDKVEIQLVNIGDGQTRIDVTSKSKAQLIDWGKNKKNINDFYKTMDYLMERHRRLN